MISSLHIDVYYCTGSAQHTKTGEAAQVNESNKLRQTKMDRQKSKIIFCPLRDDVPPYYVRKHRPHQRYGSLKSSGIPGLLR